jgi:hypothetical protein
VQFGFTFSLSISFVALRCNFRVNYRHPSNNLLTQERWNKKKFLFAGCSSRRKFEAFACNESFTFHELF